ATYIIDTSNILVRELKEQINHIFVENKNFESLIITVCSFGFKYGIPIDSDLVFDVRFLPNPFYIQELKELTGNDSPVSDYVMSFDESKIFLDKLTDMVKFLIPQYIKEGKNQLVISIGCTGGKHRSVTLANALYNVLKEEGHSILIKHNDIEKDSRHKK
ncbi:MAG TPA: RNase adaptor protein RapZ, partial [Candidatus Fimicola cottocaccae]|nr:RNase adaptor protein RapZ [Candidatus Fimicola cottocaccae]